MLFALGINLPGEASAQTGEERSRIVWTLQRGRLLFGIDRAAWVATDDLLARLPNPQAAGIRGYVVEPHSDGLDVIFYGGPEGAPVQVYRGRVAAGGVVSREIFAEGARPALSAAQRRMIEAVSAARASGRRPCGNAPFNALVIPPERPEGPIDVYLMTPQVDRQLPFGGHFRVTVAPDGRIASQRAFTNSCLLMPPGPPGAVGLMVTHLLDDVPTEIHVFSTMAAGVPVYVGTSDPDRTWEVTQQQIRLVEGR